MVKRMPHPPASRGLCAALSLAVVKRAALTIILFLLLVSGGAIVNVAVAWGIAGVLPDPSRMPDGWDRHCYWRTQGLTYNASRRSAFGRTIVWIGQAQSGMDDHESLKWNDELPAWSVAHEVRERGIVLEKPQPTYIPPGWPWQTRERNVGVTDRAVGWPLRSMLSRCRTLGAGNGPFRLESGMLLDCRQTPRGWLFRILPLQPLWPGFLVNTMFCAAILWLLIPGPFMLRRLIRIKRGRCPQCGYDLRGAIPGAGAGCPECGWERDGIEPAPVHAPMQSRNQ